MRITVAQLNPTVGDIYGNLEKISNTLNKVKDDSPDLVVFPELFLVGYPPRDLLESTHFINQTQEAVGKLMEISTKFPNTGVLIGTPRPTVTKKGKGLHNSVLLIYQGQLLLEQHKSLLPTYDVFDEARYFDPSPIVQTVSFKGETLGISICEDMWNDADLWPHPLYDFDPIAQLAEKGASMMINISASPFHDGKIKIRHHIVQSHVARHKIPFVFVNQVGANDELIFDGNSFCMDRSGKIIKLFSSFEEEIGTVDLKLRGASGNLPDQNPIKSVHDALVLGIKDYFQKCGFTKAVIGLSGGIDSAVTCALAKEALGSENVLGITMPSPYSSKGSVDDSKKLAANLGIRIKTIPIEGMFHAYLESLKEHFEGKESGTTEENIQARIRGNILMAFSNKNGSLVLSTGNKSELAVGYCTLYGDMAGSLAVISDVPKTMVYELAHFMNEGSETIPWETIEKPPSAELRPNQVDQDTLPPYEVLDELLECYIEKGCSTQDMVAMNFDHDTIAWVVRAVNNNEYKRRQSAMVLRVTTKAFGMGRRFPIAAKYGN